MKKILLVAALCAIAAPALADTGPSKGQMLHDGNGGRLAPVYKVNTDGSVQVIAYGKIVTIPANTLSQSGDDLKTNMTPNQIMAMP